MRSTLFLNSQTAEQTIRVKSPISQVKICYLVKYFQRLLRETGVWSTCVHPHLAPFIGICYEVTRGYRVPCLISPFYENGTIMQYLSHNSNAARMDLVHFALWWCSPRLRRTGQLRQFISGLAYLHSRAIVHGDLKPVWHYSLHILRYWSWCDYLRRQIFSWTMRAMR